MSTSSSSLFSSRRGAPAGRRRGGASRASLFSSFFRNSPVLLSPPSLSSFAAVSTPTSTTARSFSPLAPHQHSSFAPAAATTGRRRAAARAAASSPNDQQAAEAEAQAELTAELEEAVERAAASLDELLQQVLRECVAEQAASFLRGGGGDDASSPPRAAATTTTTWPPPDTLEGIVRGAVAQRVEWLDDAFLAALDAYAQAIDARMRKSNANANAANNAAADDSARLLDVLLLVRREVLAQVSSRLPATVQVLDAALRETEAQARLRVVERALAGGGGGLPGVAFDALASTAGQLVDDMEDAEAVPDRALLARLVLLREELRAMHARREYFPPSADGGNANNGGAAVFGFHRSNLPRACAAFAKELVAVGDGNRRVVLLAKAFEEDWTGGVEGRSGAGKKGGDDEASGGGGGGFGKSSAKKQQQQTQRKEAPDVVRPGRFLATVHAMSGELEARLRSGGGGDAEASAAAVLRRLDEVRMEAVAVLDRMQRRGGGSSSR